MCTARRLRPSLVALLALAAALARPAPARADLVVWHAYRGERAGFEKVVAAYNARQGSGKPKVAPLAIPFDGMSDKITAAVPRGKGPDIFIYPQDRLGGWVEAGNTVEPIDFFVDAQMRRNYLPTTMQGLTYRNTLYGLPTMYKVVVLWFNKKLVDQPPRTTAELAALARKLTRRDSGQYGLAYDYGNYYYHAALQNGFGGHAFDARLQPTMDCPENVRAAELMVKWRDDFLPTEPSGTLVASLFNEGKAAMIINGPWFMGEVDSKIDYGLATLPLISEAGNQPMRPWMTIEGMFIAAPSTQKEAAFEFVKFATGPEAGRIMALEGHATPADMRVYADPAVSGDAHLKVFFKQAAVSIPMPNVPEMTSMWGPATMAMGPIMRKAMTPQAALTKAQQQLAKDVAALQGSRKR